MPWEKSWGATNGHGKLRYPFPPTVFYMMKRDVQTKMQIQKALIILKNNRVPADYVYVRGAGRHAQQELLGGQAPGTRKMRAQQSVGRAGGGVQQQQGKAQRACDPGRGQSLTGACALLSPSPMQIDSRPVTPDWLSMRSVYISPSQSAQIQKYLYKIKVLDSKGNVRYDVRVVSPPAGWQGCGH